MFFWFKKRKVILECFTTNEIAYNYAKIESMINFLPDWWKRTKVSYAYDGKFFPTIKKCVGITEFYKKGIAIPLWAKIRVEIVNNEFRWFSSNPMDLNNHPPEQFAEFAESDGYNIKILSPWHMRTRELKYFSWTNPIYNNRNLINVMTIMPAVVEFKYNRNTNFNFFATTLKEDKIIEIEPFTPLVVLHSLFEENIEIKNFLVDQKELNKINYPNNFFISQIPNFKLYSDKKKIIDRIESKCPFHEK